jgi:tetratricopeptide (TPR) repeat protein
MVIMSQELFDKAVQLEEDGHAEAALAAWRELATSNPTRNVYLRLARSAKSLGLINDAEGAFANALRIDDRSAQALVGLGTIALNRSNWGDAESYLRAACAIEDSPSTLTLLGVALRHLGRNLDAEQAYRQAIRLDPDWGEAYFNLGVLLQEDQRSVAQALFRRALSIDPEYAVAHRELGWLLHKDENLEEAGMHLRKAIELDPDDAWAHIYLGSYLWGTDTESAVSEFQIAREIRPDWTVPLWSLGNIHEFVLDDFDSAQSFFERALRLHPDDTVTLTNFGRLCKKRGQFDLAKHYLERAVFLDPLSEKARHLLADIASQSAG